MILTLLITTAKLRDRVFFLLLLIYLILQFVLEFDYLIEYIVQKAIANAALSPIPSADIHGTWHAVVQVVKLV